MAVRKQDYIGLPLKIIIAGPHCCGKADLANKLYMINQKEYKIGKVFTDCPEQQFKDCYNGPVLEHLSTEDIKLAFENNALLFVTNYHDGNYYEGVTKYEFEHNNVFVLSPEQIINMPAVVFGQYRILIIWLDADYKTRREKYMNEERKYDFLEREAYDKDDMETMIPFMKQREYLYFRNSDNRRTACVIHALYQNPDLINLFINNYKASLPASK